MEDLKVYEVTSLPEHYNHVENVATIKTYVEEIRRMNAEYAVKIGQRLLFARENVVHGKWYDMLDELGFSSTNAERLMKIARTFGENPSMLAGMTKSKAYLLSTLPEENLIQLREDEILVSSDGGIYTIAEIQEMTGKQLMNELNNLRNQKNGEIREYRDRAQNAEQELDAIRKQSEEREDFTRKLMTDKDAAFAEKVGKLELMIVEKEEDTRKLRLELMKLNESEGSEQDLLVSIGEAKKAVDAVFFRANSMRFTSENRRAQAELFSFIEWGRKTITSISINAENMSEDDE